MKGNLKIFVFFFLAAIIGTLLHEYGHALVARYFGYHPTVHYAYTTLLTNADRLAISNGSLPYSRNISLWITAGGPIQTILTGFVGLGALVVLNKRTKIDVWKTKHLFWIVLTFFHSREVFNILTLFFKVKTMSDTLSARGFRGDEARIMDYFGIHMGIGNWVLLLVSSGILAYTTFVLVKRHRWQLIIFGALGSLIGGFSWLRWLGEILMP